MTLKVQLIKDSKVILEVPLNREEWEKEALESELKELESTLDAVAEMHNVFSNKMRTKMLCEMIRTSDRRFSELMDVLDANQKVISENLQRMAKNGLVTRVKKKPSEVHYIPTELGFASILACRVMWRILDEFE
jgi:DNA-binding HxlR family transcriptional regulator